MDEGVDAIFVMGWLEGRMFEGVREDLKARLMGMFCCELIGGATSRCVAKVLLPHSHLAVSLSFRETTIVDTQLMQENI